mmetsp:Transcript_1680/g.4995  ORF Transcript_1680/g.4995 Transcript_1680/m.4995 type:complete len:338 (+) Transcript_1680:762-1775(+)
MECEPRTLSTPLMPISMDTLNTTSAFFMLMISNSSTPLCDQRSISTSSFCTMGTRTAPSGADVSVGSPSSPRPSAPPSSPLSSSSPPSAPRSHTQNSAGVASSPSSRRHRVYLDSAVVRRIMGAWKALCMCTWRSRCRLSRHSKSTTSASKSCGPNPVPPLVRKRTRNRCGVGCSGTAAGADSCAGKERRTTSSTSARRNGWHAPCASLRWYRGFHTSAFTSDSANSASPRPSRSDGTHAPHWHTAGCTPASAHDRCSGSSRSSDGAFASALAAVPADVAPISCISVVCTDDGPTSRAWLVASASRTPLPAASSTSRGAARNMAGSTASERPPCVPK